MENTLVTELRSITAAALTAMSAAERANWEEAEKCVCDLGDRVTQELNGGASIGATLAFQ